MQERRIHKLKCWPSHHDAIKRGDKTYEVRKNDRDYAVGDLLHLQRYDPELGYQDVEGQFYPHTPHKADLIVARVVQMTSGFGLPADTIVMGIRIEAATLHVPVGDESGRLTDSEIVDLRRDAVHRFGGLSQERELAARWIRLIDEHRQLRDLLNLAPLPLAVGTVSLTSEAPEAI